MLVYPGFRHLEINVIGIQLNCSVNKFRGLEEVAAHKIVVVLGKEKQGRPFPLGAVAIGLFFAVDTTLVIGQIFLSQGWKS